MTSTTPAKRRPADEMEDVVGYVHYASPMKKAARNNTNYFNCLLQTEKSTYDHLVAFSPEQRQLFVHASETKTPIRLKNVSKSRSPTSPSGTSICCKKTTQISLPTTDVQFHFKQRHNTPLPQIQLADVQEQITGANVTVAGQIIREFTTQTWKTRAGHDILLKDVVIADSTASVKLALSADHKNKVVVGKSYRCTSVNIKDLNGKKFVATTPSTTIDICNDIVDIKEDEALLPVTISGTPTSITVEIIKSCNSCHATLTISPRQKFASTFKCPSCKMTQLQARIQTNFIAKMQLPGNSSTYILTHNVVQSCLDTAFLENPLLDTSDTNALEKYFLTNDSEITIMADSLYPLTLRVHPAN
ncbi:uncharacterized protein LOC117340741 [Pecten maximus]|uniref:uncharacterized protein LOC117340741 n=1 Tax=Pecten maximus TaxID=6579 RepID=UPI00145911E4|nr:uncharacterized protein LOC117340741 [Pecten maximus]